MGEFPNKAVTKKTVTSVRVIPTSTRPLEELPPELRAPLEALMRGEGSLEELIEATRNLDTPVSVQELDGVAGLGVSSIRTHDKDGTHTEYRLRTATGKELSFCDFHDLPAAAQALLKRANRHGREHNNDVESPQTTISKGLLTPRDPFARNAKHHGLVSVKFIALTLLTAAALGAAAWAAAQ